MHFWINKPAGWYYGFAGRQYLATPRPNSRLNPRQMVTPLHPFQTLSSAGNVAGPSNVYNCREFGSTQLYQLNNIYNNVTTVGNNQLILSNATATELSRCSLDFSEFNDEECGSYRYQCGVCISIMLVVGSIAAIKLYFVDPGQTLHKVAFWSLLTLLFFAFLFYISCPRSQCNHHQQRHVQEEHSASVTTTSTIPNENIKPISIVRENPPPPPYHIAISIPPPNPSEEAPPPSYNTIMR